MVTVRHQCADVFPTLSLIRVARTLMRIEYAPPYIVRVMLSRINSDLLHENWILVSVAQVRIWPLVAASFSLGLVNETYDHISSRPVINHPADNIPVPMLSTVRLFTACWPKPNT
jgi:hypothetical protein